MRGSIACDRLGWGAAATGGASVGGGKGNGVGVGLATGGMARGMAMDRLISKPLPAKRSVGAGAAVRGVGTAV